MSGYYGESGPSYDSQCYGGYEDETMFALDHPQGYARWTEAWERADSHPIQREEYHTIGSIYAPCSGCGGARACGSVMVYPDGLPRLCGGSSGCPCGGIAAYESPAPVPVGQSASLESNRG